MKTIHISGHPFTTSIGTWQPPERRFGSLLVLGSVATLVVIGLVLWALSMSELALWLVVLLVLLLLALEVAIVFMAPSNASATTQAPAPASGEVHPHQGPAYPGSPPWTPTPTETEGAPRPEIITLKCGDCGTVFDVEDFGVRPLRHTCPGCGAEGVLRGESRGPVAPSVPASAPAHAIPAKRLKLRCGGCGQVFVLEDPGTRPLRGNCPNCGRLGEIK